jgi:hypothetical protein
LANWTIAPSCEFICAASEGVATGFRSCWAWTVNQPSLFGEGALAVARLWWLARVFAPATRGCLTQHGADLAAPPASIADVGRLFGRAIEPGDRDPYTAGVR